MSDGKYVMVPQYEYERYLEQEDKILELEATINSLDMELDEAYKQNKKSEPKKMVLCNDGFHCPTCNAKIESRMFYAFYCNECGQKFER